MAGFSICERYKAISIYQNTPWKSSENAGVTQGSKYAIIRLNVSEQDANMSKYVWIYNNRQGTEYVLLNA